MANQELARLASFPELNPDSIVELDPDGQITYMNPATVKQFPECGLREERFPLIADLPAIAPACASKAILR